MLSYEDPGRAADWIVSAFGFRERERFTDDDGTVGHVVMELDGDEFHLGYPSQHYQSPRHHAEVCEQAQRWSESPYIVDGVLVYVGDIAAHFERAKAAGARILTELEDNPGIDQRQYRAEDLEGHRWMFAQSVGESR